jgi:hypothetical protein
LVLLAEAFSEKDLLAAGAQPLDLAVVVLVDA